MRTALQNLMELQTFDYEDGRRKEWRTDGVKENE